MEKVLTKYFWIFNVTSLVILAYFMASGIQEIAVIKLMSALGVSGEEDSPGLSTRRISTSKSFSPQNGDIIIKRNIFDSTFVETEVDEEEFEEEPELVDGLLPLVPCSNSKIKLLATVASRKNTYWSFASVSENRNTKLVRVGDELDNKSVSGITWRYLFLKNSTEECYMDLFSDPKNPAGVVSATAARRRARTPDQESTKDSDLANGITVVSETERIIKRNIIDNVLKDPTSFIKTVRVLPQKKDGKVTGFKLRRFKRNGAMDLLGAKRGDIIHSVNGVELTSVDKALTAYQTLRTSGELNFSITRRGKPMNIKIAIE